MRVAFSRTGQPPWVRVLKWIVIVGISLMLWRTAWFRWWIVGAPAAGLIVHFFWRWKTHGWTRPWIGWDDVEAIDRSEAFPDRNRPERR
jgi:hypothetical protein